MVGEDGKDLVYTSRESSTLFQNTYPLMPMAVLINNPQYTNSYIQFANVIHEKSFEKLLKKIDKWK